VEDLDWDALEDLPADACCDVFVRVEAGFRDEELRGLLFDVWVLFDLDDFVLLRAMGMRRYNLVGC
jgi:hypothetical protein